MANLLKKDIFVMAMTLDFYKEKLSHDRSKFL